jgi:hypothetical protein
MVIAKRTNNADKLILLLIKLIIIVLEGLEAKLKLRLLYVVSGTNRHPTPWFVDAKVAQPDNPTKLFKHL